MSLSYHPTAISRSRLSVPTRTALDEGLILPGASVLDWGCGRGFDYAYLKEHGHGAWCYDPNSDEYSRLPPSGSRFHCVICNYAINVIEEPQDRLHTLLHAAAFLYPEGLLLVTARPKAEIDANARKGSWPRQGDGYRVGRAFQRGFTPDEVCALLVRAGLQPEPWRVPGASACIGRKVGGLAGLFGRR